MNMFSDITYFVIYHIVGYRRKIVIQNLKNSFPNKSDEERKAIMKRYYHHISDLLIEGIHNLYADPVTILKRYHFVNREVVDKYYQEGKSVILMSAHYNNWEYMISILDIHMFHHGIGVGKPLHNKRLAKYVHNRRARYGTEIVNSENIRDVMAYYDRYHVPVAYMMLCDQAQHNPRKSYWTQFLHQDTGWIFGPEHFARKYNYPVIYYIVRKVKRGHYEVHFEELCPEPHKVPQYSITEQYVRKLEKEIEEAPQYWLWSHKRWKKKRPKDM